MKLIIECTEQTYSECKKISGLSETAFVIANGKPYTEPLGDLICRSDALKAVDIRHEELLHDTEYRRKHCQIDLLGIKKHIFAIPPVEARPQGEWIDERNDGGGCIAICSNCKTLEVTGRFCRTCGSDNTQSFLKSFNCGADMKGGAEND